ncbi:MAG: 6,7-dimethyl-8-ribityllumazine synthase [Alphaproteobacteria bacterium]|nr:6,7-dimethyl-8-ribityllumazine synthase [Alphaproteobacteria bacterium]
MTDEPAAPVKDQTDSSEPIVQSDVSNARALIVEGRFYDDIQDALLEGALAELKAAGVGHDVVTVPGALEIPAAIAIAIDAASRDRIPYDMVVALGCVIRGETLHFEVVSMESARGLMDLAVARKLPLGNGILTVNTKEQALERAWVNHMNKGGAAARTALAMLRVKRNLKHVS